MNFQKNQKGSSLLLCLIALAIITTLINKTHLFLNHSQRVVSSQLDAEIVNEYLLAGEAWIEQQLLVNEWTDRNGQILSKVTFELEDGLLEIVVSDLDSCINVNKLIEGERQINTYTALMRLSEAVDASPEWASVIKDWIDDDGEVGISGAEDSFYVTKSTPYRTANSKMTGDYEWTLLNLNYIEFEKALKSVCAVDDINSTVNINTAPAEVISALLPDMTSTQIESVIERQQNEGFSRLEDFTNNAEFKNITLSSSEWAATTSNVAGLVKLTINDKTKWLQTNISIGNNNIVQSNSRGFLAPNKLVKQRFDIKEDSND